MLNSKLFYNILKIAGIIACVCFWYLVIFTESFHSGDTISDIYGFVGTLVAAHGFTIFIFKHSKNAI
jgi:hypothetical protein